MAIKSAPTPNSLLAGLPKADQQLLLAECEPIDLVFAQVLAEPQQLIEYVYLPMDSFVSSLASIDGKTHLEVGLTGNEGILGATLALGVYTAPLHVMVQGGGAAYRVPVEPFCHVLRQSPALEQSLKRYLYVLFEQMAQTAACTRFHIVEARLARWLLMTQDRAHSNQFHITQKFLAYMLGVRRVGVTEAAQALQQQELIHYHRGNIEIINRSGLEKVCCSCYQADKASYALTMK